MAFFHFTGGAGNDSYVLSAAVEGVKYLSDSGGVDTLNFTDVALALTRLQPGVVGFWRFRTDLLVDLDRDGEGIDGWDDLAIKDFFANSHETTPGSGFIETIGTFSGADILKLDLNDDLMGGEGNDRLDGGVGKNRLTGGAGDDTYIVTARGAAVA